MPEITVPLKDYGQMPQNTVILTVVQPLGARMSMDMGSPGLGVASASSRMIT